MSHFRMCLFRLHLTFSASAGAPSQLSLCLAALRQHLHQCRLSWAHALNLHLYLADMAQFGAVNEVYVRHISESECREGVPSRATVEVPFAALSSTEGSDHGLVPAVVVEVLACQPSSPLAQSKEGEMEGCGREVLHVQSISRWAPACIGPYSQVGPVLKRQNVSPDYHKALTG